MKIYVASAFGNKDAVRDMQAFMRQIGHTITHDWTGEDVAGYTGEALRDYTVKCATDDMVGVIRSDVLIALNHPKGCGLWWECGIALGHDIPIILVSNPGDPWTIFMDLPGVYTVEDERGLLNALEAVVVDKVRRGT